MKRRLQLGLVIAAAGLAARSSAAELATLRNGFTISFERSEARGQQTRLYLRGAGPAGYVEVPTREIILLEHEEAAAAAGGESGARTAEQTIIHESVSAASARYGIDRDLIESVIRAESGFQPRAVSPRGALGLMQLMPATAASLHVSSAFDPAANVEGGASYLQSLLRLYHSDVIKALAAYNAGPQRVARYHGVPPYRETHAYVARVISDFNRKKLAQQGPLAARGRTPPARPPRSASLRAPASGLHD